MADLVRPTRQEARPPDAVAKWLRQRREALGLSSTELARKIGVSPAFVSLVESGRKRPGPDTALRIAKALGVPEPVLEAWLKVYDPENIEESVRAAEQLFEHIPEMASTTRAQSAARARERESELAAAHAQIMEMAAAYSSTKTRVLPEHERIAEQPRPAVTPDRVLSLLRERSHRERLIDAERLADPEFLRPVAFAFFEGNPQARLELAERWAERDPEFLSPVVHRLLETHPEILESALHRAQAARPSRLRAMLAGFLRHTTGSAARPLEIPLLPAGVEPTLGGNRASIHVDAKLLSPQHRDASLFAYRLSKADAAHASEILEPGDVVVLSSKCWPIDPGAVCAVRMQERLLLARVTVTRSTLVVVSGDPQTGIEILPLEDPSKPPPSLLAKLVLVIRSQG